MSDYFDDVLRSAQQEQDAKEVRPTALEPFDKEALKEKKQTELSDAYRLADVTAERAANSPEVYASYLSVQARFNRYSVNNALLIAAQKPDAVKLATFDEWKENNVQIVAGEKSIVLLEPAKEFQREDGSVGAAMRVKRVFDVSQTTAGLQLPEIRRDPKLVMKALVSNAPCRLEISDDKVPPNTAAVYKPEEKTIYVRHGLGFDDMFRAMARELAFAHLDKGSGFSRTNLEFQAKSIACLVCARNHIAPEPVTFPGSFSNREAKEIKQVLGKIRDVANAMHGNMEQVFGRQAQAKQAVKDSPDRDAR